MKFSMPLLYLFILFFTIACTGTSDSGEQTNNSDTTATTPAVDSQAFAPPVSNSITGTYIYGDQEGAEGGGYLVIQETEDDSLKFELDINNGAPNYHSGSMTGKMAKVDQVATFSTTEFDGNCTVKFTFKGKDIEVEQVAGSDFICGFGQGVMADGTYTKDKDEAIFQYEGGF